jgi:hypothetical protein
MQEKQDYEILGIKLLRSDKQIIMEVAKKKRIVSEMNKNV